MSDSDKARDRKQRCTNTSSASSPRAPPLSEEQQAQLAALLRGATSPTNRQGVSAAPGAASRSTTTASAADHCVTTLRASYSLQPSSASLALIPSRLGLISAFAHSSATVSTASARG